MPTFPSLPDADRVTTYTVSSASRGPFDVGFDIYGDGQDYDNWVEVWLDNERQTGNWEMTSDSGPSLRRLARPIEDAQITFNAAITGELIIVGARVPRRTSQFENGVAVPADSHNRAYNDLMAIAREMWDRRERTIEVAPGVAPLDFPDPESGKIIGWDGEELVNLTLPSIVVVTDGYVFQTRAEFLASTILGSVNGVLCIGYRTAGDTPVMFGYKRWVSPTAAGDALLNLNSKGYAQHNDGSWWKLVADEFNPVMFGAYGDAGPSGHNDIAAINDMHRFAPDSSKFNWINRDFLVQKTADDPYILSRKSQRHQGPGGPCHDGSFGISSTNDIWLVEPAGLDGIYNINTLFHFQLIGLSFGVMGEAPQAFVHHFADGTWTSTQPWWNYGRHLISVRAPIRNFGTINELGTGLGFLRIADCLMVATGGPGGGMGRGFSIHVEAEVQYDGGGTLLAQGSIYEYEIIGNFAMGGIRVWYTADTGLLARNRCDGKQGIEMLILPGAVETVVRENTMGPYGGSSIVIRWCSKLLLENNNIEQKLDTHVAEVSGNLAVIDIANDMGPAGIKANRIVARNNTIANLVPGGAVIQQLFHIDNAVHTVIDGNNLYNTAPSTLVGIDIGSGCLQTFYGINSFYNVPTKMQDSGVGTYGVSKPSSAWTYASGWSSDGTSVPSFRKDESGYVRATGAISKAGALAVETAVTFPTYFRPAIPIRMALTTDTGADAVVTISTGGVLAVASVGSGSPTKLYLDGLVFLEASHDNQEIVS